MTWWNQLPQASPLDAALAAEGVTGPLAQLAQSVYQQESSGGRNTQTSNAGAVGGMQIIPSTFASVADEGWDINDPVLNARAGVRYLGQMYERGGNDPRMAAIGYYGGPGAIDAARRGQARSDPRNPHAPNTFQYAEQVVGRFQPEQQQTGPVMAALGRASQAVIPAAQAGGNWWESMPAVEPEQSTQSNWWDAAPIVDQTTDQQPGFIGQVGRQLGLTARAGLEGVSALPEMLINPISQALGGPEMRISDTLDAIGFPQPENATERIAQNVAGAMAGAGGIAGGANLAARGLTGAGQAVATQMGSAIPQQIAGAAGAGAGGGVAREAGFGPGVQTAAALGGGLLASSAANRLIAPPRAQGASDATSELQKRASNLYEQANQRGVTAQPAQTSQLQADIRRLATDEGLITPSGALAEGYPKLNGVLRMVDEYAGQPMTGKQLQSVRRLLSSAAGSSDRAESRIGTMMIRAFDDFTAPLAPELAEARNLYASAMRSQQLETMRELAESAAKGKYTQAGLEHGLRSEYRKLYNRILSGKERGFNPDQTEAIRRVVEGTPLSNSMRYLGKFAPTGPVSTMAGSTLPFMAGNAIGGPVMGVASSMGTMGLGMAGRSAATALTSRNAAIAEALARNMPLTSSVMPQAAPHMGALYGAALQNMQ